ncbi:MAG: UDP-N-acetylmuramoyl-L-alanine--D-glutamate ligase [Desulfovibrionaceae bacterium]|nr:UDP-N-acetylmuramoyl-L-alanine--D-glutamate ligase [Desulfovibrionaceae bacterium]
MQGQLKINLSPGRQAVVVGAGASGLAACRLLSSMGLSVRLLEKKESQELAKLASENGWDIYFGEHHPAQFDGASVIVPSPGLALARLKTWLPAGADELVMGEMELAWHQVDEPIIAITGTSGKTTTASLCAAMLEAAGKRVFLGGNIGTPLSEYVLARKNGAPRADVLVLEISSFQLQTCSGFHPHIGMLLNPSENHLDYHADMQEYGDAKFKLFARQNKADYAVFSPSLASDPRLGRVAAQKIFFEAGPEFQDVSLLGSHNQANLAAAWQAALIFGVELKQAQKAAREFKAPPHRLEVLGPARNGVLFVNDSKSTTVESLRVALTAMEKPVLLLAGGVFKGGDLASLAPLIREKVRAIGLFGAGREVFEPAWLGLAPMTWSENMQDAVSELMKEAKKNDVMLLSPATASFDLYANYKARGDDFKKIWESLR